MDVMDNKNKLLNLKKLIKVEPNSGQTQRLQSLRLPRDLSLGGTKIQKKQFVPNVNVARNKQNIKEIVKKNGFEKKGRNNWEDNKNGNRNKSRGKYVESSGIFSEGAGSITPHHVSYKSDRSGEKENDGAVAAMVIPTIQRNTFEIDKETEDNVLNQLVGYYNEEEDDEKYPFQPITWQNSFSKEIKHELNAIKIEKDDVESKNTQGFIQPKLEPLDYTSSNYAEGEYFEEDSLNNDKPSLSLWSLPDSFAGKGLSDDPNCTKLFDYCLNDMLEGKIGKLVIRKSGKIEVHIGQVKYNLEPGDIDAYEEKIVSMETEKLQHAAVLGQIRNRYFLHPDWDSLFL
ncbi:unnamed protein product [Phaedon cochleariae]|uniref:RNA polymerase III RPC4 n=1 Tax=Phaedon cochleariae TaxID=80249 RepID=A0A9N9SES5_PHACE|nr:unnamed protein product [Phaedon cochleariae]